MENTFNNFDLETKVQCYDKYGYYIMKLCGTIVTKLPDGHAIIKNFDGDFISSVGVNNLFEIEQLNSK
jgi:hypothetical protein